MGRRVRLLFVVLLVIASAGILSTSAAPIELEIFDRAWSRPDQPVSSGMADRTWIYGPEPFTGAMMEPYVEAPDGMRTVQYFDKTRMEDNSFRASPPWDVSNGLLATELMTGRMQLGDDLFEEREPADVHVAGDPGDPDAPTYASFGKVMENDPIPAGWTIIQTIDVDGNIGANPDLAQYGVTASHYEPVTDHNVASVFWDFMNSSGLVYENGQYSQDLLFLNPYYVTGYPLTEAYWAVVNVGGTPAWVLTQAFERRVLTFTPDNPDDWQVEAGNVGQHYYQWRYEQPSPDHLVINEVMFWPEADEQAALLGPAWLEIANPTGESVDLSGWNITVDAGAQRAELPAWALPPGGHLQVVFASGASDSDFSDGSGTYFAGSGGEFLRVAGDGVALYSGEPDSTTIVDFMAWAYLGDYSPGAGHDHAVATGIWSAGARFEAYGGEDPGTRPDYVRIAVAEPGQSLGRDRLSTDTNTPGDWGFLGGTDALEPTPGEVNDTHTLADLVEASQFAEQATMDESAGDVARPQAVKKWTVMVYVDGRDPRIYEADYLRLLEIQELTGVSNDDINVVFQVSGISFNSYMVRSDLVPGRTHGDLGPHEMSRTDTNPGDPAELRDFITWSRTNYPAEHYAIILSGHGRGWKGLFPAGPDHDFLTMSELSDGLSALGQPFDIVFLYACLMGQVEVAHQIAEQAEYLVASPQNMWAGYRYNTLAKTLMQSPDLPANLVAEVVIDVEEARQKAITRNPVAPAPMVIERNVRTMAVIDPAIVESEVSPAVDVFAIALREDVQRTNEPFIRDDNHQLILRHQARALVKEYADTNFVDLYRFAELVRGTSLNAAGVAQPVMRAIEDAVLYEVNGPGRGNESSHGLSIYFPRTQLLPDERSNPTMCGPDTPICKSAYAFANPHFDPLEPLPTSGTHLYKRDASIKIPRLRNEPHPMLDDPNFAFPAETTWDEFLYRYYKPAADACILLDISTCVRQATLQIGETVTLIAYGSSDGDSSDGGARYYFWDFDIDEDDPAPVPTYPEGEEYVLCEEDCDRDQGDSGQDDPDAFGGTPDFTCTTPGTHQIRVMVLDDHHLQGRVGNEDQRHNDGRHWLHFNVDDAWVVIHCEAQTAGVTKRPDRALVQPGEWIVYTITMPASAELEAPSEGYIVDPINADFLPGMQDPILGPIECSSGECYYDSSENYVVWFGTVNPRDLITLSYSIQVPENLLPSEYPDEYVNCAGGYDGLEEFFEVCASVAFLP